MIHALWLASVLSLFGASPRQLPKEKDPCMLSCQDDYRKKTGSCHSRGCFDEATEQIKQCSLACMQKKKNQQKGPQDCTDDKGRKVPCSQLPHVPQPAR